MHALFRSFLTIKGLAAIAGVETAREVAHHTETLLDEVRSGARPVSSALIDLALASADFLGEVVAAAERAYHSGAAPLASVEGFVRQILGLPCCYRGVYIPKLEGCFLLTNCDSRWIEI